MVNYHVPLRLQQADLPLTAVLSEAWAKLREWAILACKGRLLLSGSVVLPSLKTAVLYANTLLGRLIHKRHGLVENSSNDGEFVRGMHEVLDNLPPPEHKEIMEKDHSYQIPIDN